MLPRTSQAACPCSSGKLWGFKRGRIESASAHRFTLFASKRVEEKCLKRTSPVKPESAPECLSKSLTQESHLDENSAETIEREQREQLATFENMLRKTKVDLSYAMMRRSKKFYSMSRQCEQLRRCSSSQLR